MTRHKTPPFDGGISCGCSGSSRTFGLMNTGAMFQTVMDSVVARHHLSAAFCKVYVDDLLIHSPSWEEHLGHVEKLNE